MQEDYTRRAEALENEIRGHKQDKQRLELHLRRSAVDVERLQQLANEEEERFNEGGEELKRLREEARRLTHSYHGLESEIRAK